MINKFENNGNRYCHFFIPELENFSDEEKMKFIKDELLKEDPNFFTNYESNRETGENSSHICSLIRQDFVEDFIIYMNRQNISPSSELSPSTFETNQFLIDNKNTTLIEYSAFFGSIQIFQYLLMNNAELTPSLWLYAIHSKNAELIHLIESNKVFPPKNYEQCLFESIKCHHNDIAEYFKNNFIDQSENDSRENEEIISNCIKYHNYLHFQNDNIIDHGFFYLHFYHYDKLFELLLSKKKESIEEKMIKYENVRDAANNNEVEVVYLFLLQMQEISTGLISYSSIKQIAIPSSVTSIGDAAFRGSSSLTQISIPSSVTSIGNSAFYKCSSLAQITIPSSVTSIGDYAFSECSSLTQITIPSSVTSIGNLAFSECSSLAQVTIPSSVTSIGECAFIECKLLDKFTIIPCRKKLIEFYDDQFLLCKSNLNSEVFDTLVWVKSTINSVIIPTFIMKIASGLFFGCSSLTQITFSIPSSVTYIGNAAFSGCSSLTQITIPSSVTSIGSYTFSGCSSLTQITIPSSVISIGNKVFNGIKSLTINGDTQKIFNCIFKNVHH